MAPSEPPAEAGLRSKWFVVAVLGGVSLVALSFLPAFASGKARWTPDKARAYQEASVKIQELSHKVAQESPDTVSRATSDEVNEALDNFDQLRHELESVRSQSGLWAIALRAIGICLVALGIAGYVASTRSA
jgi:hypothetical protein